MVWYNDQLYALAPATKPITTNFIAANLSTFGNTIKP